MVLLDQLKSDGDVKVLDELAGMLAELHDDALAIGELRYFELTSQQHPLHPVVVILKSRQDETIEGASPEATLDQEFV